MFNGIVIRCFLLGRITLFIVFGFDVREESTIFNFILLVTYWGGLTCDPFFSVSLHLVCSFKTSSELLAPLLFRLLSIVCVLFAVPIHPGSLFSVCIYIGCICCCTEPIFFIYHSIFIANKSSF